MPEAKYKDLIEKIRKGKFAPVYFLHGEEPYFIDHVSELIEQNALQEHDKEFNQTICYGRDTDVLGLISAARRYPLMAERQLIIVREAQNIDKLIPGSEEGKSKSKKGQKDDAPPPLLEYIMKPTPTTILVFCYKHKKLDKRTLFAKALLENSEVMESARLRDQDVVGWINDYTRSKNIKINDLATGLLADHLGNDLSRITNEISKLLINKKEGEEISMDDVHTFIGISRDFNTFELQKAISAKDILKANKIMNYFIDNPKEHPMELTMSLLFTFFTKVLWYQSLNDKSPKNILAEMGLNSWALRDIELAARNYNLSKLVRIIGYLHDYDVKSKGGDGISYNRGELQKELLFKILH